PINLPIQLPNYQITQFPNPTVSHPPVDVRHHRTYSHVAVRHEIAAEDTMADKSDILQGTLDLMVLKTLDAMGPLHGYGIARRIEQISDDVLQLNQGTIYASLLRLQQRRWISASWGTSENNRRAKYYALTKSGRKQLAAEA